APTIPPPAPPPPNPRRSRARERNRSQRLSAKSRPHGADRKETAMETLLSLSFIDLILRWGHVVFGLIWIGHLYFFNLVNVPFQGAMDKELKPKVNPQLLLRAFWWFRWGAMYTLIFGLALWTYDYFHPGKAFRDTVTGGVTGRAMWIMWAML